LDTAAAFSLLPGAPALAADDPDAFTELLTEDLRRRVIANHLDTTAVTHDTADTKTSSSSSNSSSSSSSGSVAVLLDKHPAIQAAKPCPGDTDRLVLPDSATFHCCRHTKTAAAAAAGHSGGGAVAGYYLPFKHVADAARRKLMHGGSTGGTRTNAPPSAAAAAAAPAAAAAEGSSGEGGAGASTVLKRAAWRRQLTRECSHYLAPILGKDAGGVVVLVGEW
jgi:hypothetical protein